MAKGATFKVVDHWTRNVQAKFDDINNTTLKVGVTEKSGAKPHPEGNGSTVGDIAFYNEFGTMQIPSRSFIRDWVDGNIENIAKEIGTDTLRVIMSNETMRDALKKRGKTYRESVIRRIRNRIPPPNAESTLAQKSGDIPLIDTTTLLEAIVYEVEKK